mmetsp:Transcript_120586/g.240112  ORF Transcript_120586/g.240112 Transcript_120586/m.240112 type:complete len:200 (+) Transcript_120586:338-937(+)
MTSGKSPQHLGVLQYQRTQPRNPCRKKQQNAHRCLLSYTFTTSERVAGARSSTKFSGRLAPALSIVGCRYMRLNMVSVTPPVAKRRRASSGVCRGGAVATPMTNPCPWAPHTVLRRRFRRSSNACSRSGLCRTMMSCGGIVATLRVTFVASLASVKSPSGSRIWRRLVWPLRTLWSSCRKKLGWLAQSVVRLRSIEGRH